MDAPDTVFEHWYSAATIYAADAGPVASAALRLATDEATQWAAAKLRNGTASEGEVALSCLRRIASIFATKPKLRRLLASESGPAVLGALGAAVDALASIALATQYTDRATQSSAASALVLLVDVARAFYEDTRSLLLVDVPVVTPATVLPLLPMCRVACDPAADGVLRGYLLQALLLASQCAQDVRSAVALNFSRRAVDSIALALFWQLRAIASPDVLRAIADRIDEERRRAATGSESPAGMLTAAATSTYHAPVGMETWVSRVHAVPMLHGETAARGVVPTIALYSSPTALDRLLWASLFEELTARLSRGCKASVAAGPGDDDTEALVAFLVLSDVFAFPGHQRNTAFVMRGPPVLAARTGCRLERPDEWLAAARALLEASGGPEALYSVLLQFPTLSSITMLTGMAGHCSSAALVRCVCPRVEALLDGMPPSVSGAAEDQEVINWLADTLRERYASSEAAAMGGRLSHAGGGGAPGPGDVTAAAGQALFNAGLSAIAHGYSDTERLPELLARVIRFHAARDGERTVAPWLRGAVSAEVCCSPVAMRAVMDLLASLLGLESSTCTYGGGAEGRESLGGEAAGSVGEGAGDSASHDAFSYAARAPLDYGRPPAAGAASRLERAVLAELAGGGQPGPGSVRVWRWLAESHGRVVAAHEDALARLLQNLVGTVEAEAAAAARGGGGVDYVLDDVTRLLVALLAVTPPRLAPPMLDVLASLRYAALAPERGGHGGPERLLTRRVIDEALAHVLDLLPLPPALARRVGVPLEAELPATPVALASALASESDAVALSLARIVPLACILSPAPAVRLRALQELQRRIDAAALVPRREEEVGGDAADLGVACALLLAVPAGQAGAAAACDAPLIAALGTAPPGAVAAVEAATSSICGGPGRVGLSLTRPAGAPGAAPALPPGLSFVLGARSLAAPVDDCAVLHGALLRAGAPPAARAACSAACGVLSGADPAVAASASPGLRRRLAAGMLSAALGRLLSWLAVESENTAVGLGDGERAALDAIGRVARDAPRPALVDAAATSPRLLDRLVAVSPVWAAAAPELRAAAAADPPLLPGAEAGPAAPLRQSVSPATSAPLPVRLSSPGLGHPSGQPLPESSSSSSSSAWEAFFRTFYAPRQGVSAPSGRRLDACDAGADVNDVEVELAPLLGVSDAPVLAKVAGAAFNSQSQSSAAPTVPPPMVAGGGTTWLSGTAP